MGRRTTTTVEVLVGCCLLAACGAGADRTTAVASVEAAPPGIAVPSLRVESLASATGTRLLAPPLKPRAARAGQPAIRKPVAEQSAQERLIAIYAAVIRKELGKRQQRAFVFDAPAGKGFRLDETRPGKRFDAAVRAGLRKALADLAPIQFVSDTDQGRTADRVRAKRGGLIVTLGSIVGKGDRVEVTSQNWCGNTCGGRVTWVLKRTAKGWRVTGTTSPVAAA